ncbi:cbb3-type cytochrome oxidase assembly protein CcoS [Rubripirellula reticaptiva]|uniref:Cytochrome oxidase maturation protein cbb3-type n=1 Tax=Rubripirellula reticaptiva TaxID=2528013 RepID=A0A5C6F595_9BACT|nr:cbb3-type cytochrome oxidase assembly protein CcoS [Rubripirellula reticaptiva]TWU55246.1 Cytochrome oxidase maturation protein cbb3-type [Rubripirellula reticaptiva]
MSVIYIALPIALALGGAGMIACVLCIRGGQYDDMDTPALRILIDDRESDLASENDDAVSPDESAR